MTVTLVTLSARTFRGCNNYHVLRPSCHIETKKLHFCLNRPQSDRSWLSIRTSSGRLSDSSRGGEEIRDLQSDPSLTSLSSRVPTRVLITDPEQRASLAAARALAHSGHHVVTVGPTKGLAGHSSSVQKHVALDLHSGEVGRVREMLSNVVRDERIDVVLPISDASSQLVLGHAGRIGARVVGPAPEAYARASDKEGLLVVAASCGIVTPAQHVLERRHQLSEFDAQYRFPMVIKPARSVSNVDGKVEKHGVHFVADLRELRDTVAALSDRSFPLLLQHRTMGEGIGVFLLRSGRTTLMRFGHRRLREKPPAGGVSTYREAIEPPAALVARCEALLDAVDYDGAAMIEFKRDTESGEYVLMEINARLWGSLQLAIDAGLDFPTALVDLACNRPVTTLAAAKVGVRTYWELGELDHALAIGRHSPDTLHLPPGTPVGFREGIRALFDHRPEDRCEVFRWSDPMPFAAEVIRWLGKK